MEALPFLIKCLHSQVTTSSPRHLVCHFQPLLSSQKSHPVLPLDSINHLTLTSLVYSDSEPQISYYILKEIDSTERNDVQKRS